MDEMPQEKSLEWWNEYFEKAILTHKYPDWATEVEEHDNRKKLRNEKMNKINDF